MFVVDGHNLLGAMGRDGSNQNIDFLIAYLERFARKKQQPLVVVFDNTTNFNPLNGYERKGNLEIYFSEPSIDSNADDRIVRLLGKKNKSELIVVTADRELRDRLLMIGVDDFLSPEEFIGVVEGKSGSDQVMAEMTKDEELAEAGIDQHALYDELLSAFSKSKSNIE